MTRLPPHTPDKLAHPENTGVAARMIGVLAWLLALGHWARKLFGRLYANRRACSAKPVFIPASSRRYQPKPPWVRRELIRLRAWSPELGCRTLAEVFNRRFAARGMSVGKSHVANVLRQATVEILRMRQEGKHRVPRALPINRVWAMDLTGKVDLTGRQRMMLGVLDHGSRACLRLSALDDKRSLTILRELLVAFRRFQALRFAALHPGGQRGVLQLARDESRAAKPGHSSANHGIALPLAERTDRAVLWHAQAEARSHRRREWR